MGIFFAFKYMSSGISDSENRRNTTLKVVPPTEVRYVENVGTNPKNTAEMITPMTPMVLLLIYSS